MIDIAPALATIVLMQATSPALPPPVDPPRAALPEGYEPPVPIANQGDWFPLAAYPPEARKRKEEGRVSVKLNVNSDGRPTACLVTSSSGSTILDQTTCELAMQNARFHPARLKGVAIESTFAVRGIRWSLNLGREQTFEVGSTPIIVVDNMAEVELTPEGTVADCKVIRRSDAGTNPCADMVVGRHMSPPLARGGHPIAAKAQFVTTVTLFPNVPTPTSK